ncbi:hypothetical protein [Bradyrhizobium sp. 1]|uniref:hypothetical protein n=1 Tax=Bradyrhizobium sp. 1 TaxID=241591 RepID=UPI001FFAF38F|nr:hypothetical protein [Bradyrhizobium sp. 1]MCK1393941.1 hypothetical protein [Bradyrhizobium sp. 1]
MWTEISKASFISIPIVGTLSGLLSMRTAYSTYKLIGARFGGANFPWFYTVFQSPWYAKQFWGQDDIANGLPDDLKTTVTRARTQINYGMAVIILWTIFALCVGATAAHFASGT